MAHSDTDRIIALAGIHQAAHCVQRLANRGSAEEEPMLPCLYSLFQIDAADVPAVFGPPGAVATGARHIIAQLTGQPERDLDLTRLVVALISHARRLGEQPAMLRRIRDGIEAADRSRGDRPLLDPDLIARLAGVYSATLSTLEPRIIVRGDPRYLQQAEYQERVRALLLAGVRAGILWRQVGGSRTLILFGRRRLLDAARAYLSSLPADRQRTA